ncbi:MAG TPA: hypothetical protein VK991_12605 [Halomonas sp.]|nr:hypothetical protein [Halomonas sp.]
MSLVEESKDIGLWLHTKLDGLMVPSDDRTRSAAGCFEISMEHQCAIAILLEAQLYGSLCSLARSVFESYVRGCWLKYCADESQVEKFLTSGVRATFQSLIDEIEALDIDSPKVLSQAKNAGWDLLNDFTHSGAQHVIRRNTETSISPNYDDEEIRSVVRFVNALALICGYEVYSMGDSDASEAYAEFIDKVSQFSADS